MEKQLNTDKPQSQEKQTKGQLNNLLIEAVKNLNAKKVGELLKAGADAHAKTNGRAILWDLCDAYDSPPIDKIVKLLLKYGANPNLSKKDEDGPLHYATMYCQVEAAKLLVLHGADVNAKGAYLRTPLIYAASDGDSSQLVEFLIEHGADVKAMNEGGENALFEHITRGKTNLKIVEILLDNGIPVNGKNKQFGTLLHWAAFCGRTEIASLLIRRGAKINAKNDMGETPVQQAMSQNQLKTVKALFKLGADPLTSGRLGFSLLEFATDSRDQKFVKEIISKIKKQSTEGLNALTTAARRGDLEMVKLLIGAGFDVDNKDSFGSETPLIKAAYYGRLKVVKYLLEKGANLKLKDYRGNTALLHAAYNGNTKVVAELLKKGAAINERNKLNWNPLMQACVEGHFETAKFLLEKGSPTDEIDKEKGATALTLAKFSRSQKLIELLKSYGAKERKIKMREEGEPYFSLFDCEICTYLPDKKDLGKTEYPEKFDGLDIIFNEVSHSDRYCDDTRRIMKCKNCGTYYYQYHSIDTEDAFVGGPSISQNFMRINQVWLKKVLETIGKKEGLDELGKRYPKLIEECLTMLKDKPEQVNPNHLSFVIESIEDYFILKKDWGSLRTQLLQHADAKIVLKTAKDLVMMYGESPWKWDFPQFTNYKSIFSAYQEVVKPFIMNYKDKLKQCVEKYKSTKDEKIKRLYDSVMDSAKYYKVF